MNTLLNRVLKAYRPLYQRGQLMDGPYRWPSAVEPDALLKAASPKLARTRFAALTGLDSLFSFHRNKS